MYLCKYLYQIFSISTSPLLPNHYLNWRLNWWYSVVPFWSNSCFGQSLCLRQIAIQFLQDVKLKSKIDNRTKRSLACKWDYIILIRRQALVHLYAWLTQTRALVKIKTICRSFLYSRYQTICTGSWINSLPSKNLLVCVSNAAWISTGFPATGAQSILNLPKINPPAICIQMFLLVREGQYKGVPL